MSSTGLNVTTFEVVAERMVLSQFAAPVSNTMQADEWLIPANAQEVPVWGMWVWSEFFTLPMEMKMLVVSMAFWGSWCCPLSSPSGGSSLSSMPSRQLPSPKVGW